MINILLGFKTPSSSEVPDVLLLSHKRSQIDEFVKTCKYPRLELITSPSTVRIRGYRGPEIETKANESDEEEVKTSAEKKSEKKSSKK